VRARDTENCTKNPIVKITKTSDHFLELKLNNQDRMMRGGRTKLVANTYKAKGKSWRPNRQEMVQMYTGGEARERVAENASEPEEEEEALEVTKVTRKEEEKMDEEEEEGEEERVVVMREEEDTVSPLSSRQSTVGGRNKQQDGWKTVGKKQKDAAEAATNKTNTVGVKMVRIGKAGTTGYSPRDVSHFFTMLKRIDSTAVILNSRKEITSATTMEEMEQMKAMDYKGFLDMRTDNWGGPAEHKEKTVWMCYVATDLMSPNLQQLREDKQVQGYLQAGDITMQYTKLRESNSRVAFHIANKDPKYTNRNDLEERLSNHMKQHNKKEIPIHVLNMAASGKNFNTRMCTAVVGGKDMRTVESILKEHPFTDLELIPFSWKFQDSAGYTRRLKEHEGVLKLSRAIKLEEMDIDELEDLKMLMGGDPAKEFVIDVFPATHARRTGVVYVQYINGHRNPVMMMVQEIIRKIKAKREADDDTTILPFPDGPKIVNTNGSPSPTIQTNTTNKTNSVIPSSKYGGLLDTEQLVQTANRIPWAISVNNRSFLDTVIGKVRATESDNETDTFKSATSGAKSTRETELEEENRQLTKQLAEKETQYNQAMKQLQEERREYKEMMNQIRQESNQKEEAREQKEKKRDDEREQKDRKRDEEMAEMRALIMALMSKGGEELHKMIDNQGSTPKRKKRGDEPLNNREERNPLTGTTLEEDFPEDLLLIEGTMKDAEPTTLQEGLEFT
jgi:hypothetical protein